MAKIAEVQEVCRDLLKPYKRNAKIHGEEQVKKIADSISEFGFVNPVLIDREYNIIAGHGRVLAAEKLGMDKVPCLFVEGLTEEQRRAYILADNRLAELADWNMDIVNEELFTLDLLDFDVSLTGFDLPEEDEPVEAEEDDYDESTAEARCKLGDLWQLGNHRLICGDSTDTDVLNRLLEGETGELLLTDPPYGIKADKGFSGAGGFTNPIERRHYTDDWDTERPQKDVFDCICTKAHKAIIFGGNFFTDELPVGNHWLVWNKHNTMPTFSDAELAWTNIKRNSVKLYDVEWNGLIGKEKERFHPTQKPVKLFADILKDYTEPNEIVCDFFGGSGTTLIACEQLNRKCFMCELDPHYCDVIIDRWEQFTGESAVLLNG